MNSLKYWVYYIIYYIVQLELIRLLLFICGITCSYIDQQDTIVAINKVRINRHGFSSDNILQLRMRLNIPSELISHQRPLLKSIRHANQRLLAP